MHVVVGEQKKNENYTAVSKTTLWKVCGATAVSVDMQSNTSDSMLLVL